MANQPNKITKIRLGSVLLDCTTTEEVSKKANVTKRPIEKGEDIADHMKTNPYEIRLSGMMVNDADNKIATIEQMQKNAELLGYIGKRRIDDVVIVSFSTKQNKKIMDGYDWDLSLQSVKIAQPKSANQDVKSPDGKSQGQTKAKVKEMTNAGRKQILNTNSVSRGQKSLSEAGGSMASKHSISNTNPVRVRNRMLSTLTTGTSNRASRVGGR